MFRTRDFALVFATITFLVVGIVTTIVSQGLLPGVGTMSASVFEATEEPASYEAVIPTETELSREERIASLRQKIATLGLSAAETNPEQEEVLAVSPEVTKEEAKDLTEERCSYYGVFSSVWNSTGLTIEEVEGARLIYREVQAPLTASSSSLPLVKKDILLQLAVRSLPMPTKHCVPSDVIGITTTGELIRNNEVSMYSEYGPEMLIGYALDGFPLYGVSAVPTDVCGGKVVSGQYRYSIDPGRDTIIRCFAGVPASL